MKINIRSPIWSKRAIGIAHYRIENKEDEFVDIEILYKDQHGQKPYPGLYRIKREEVFKYPTQRAQGVLLYIVPIRDLVCLSQS